MRTEELQLIDLSLSAYPSDFSAELSLAVQAALEAGQGLLFAFNALGGAPGGGGKSSSDIDAENLIHAALDGKYPEYGFRGEEIPRLNRFAAPGLEGSLRWLVDPNDGTDAFLSGRRGAAVSIGFIFGVEPVLGVVYAYAARSGLGDLFFWARGGTLTRNGRPVDQSCRVRVSGRPLVIASGGADTSSPTFAAGCEPYRFRAEPSIAYRLALVAAGEADAAFSVHNPHDYDVAGGHALLRSVGGDLYSSAGQPIRYSASENPDGSWENVGDCWGGVGRLPLELASRDWEAIKKSQHKRHPGYPFVKSERHIVFGGDPGVLDRAVGCLMGTIAGDSLGSLVEFKRAAEIAALYPAARGLDLEDGGTWGTLAGQPTDDTELALMLARTLIGRGRYDIDEVARAYGFWHQSLPFDEGATTAHALGALDRLASGRSPATQLREAALARVDSKANGALMRVAPLAIYGAFLEERILASLAMDDAALTHANPVCALSNAAFTAAIAALIRGDSRQAAWEAARRAVGEAAARYPAGASGDVIACLDAAASGFPDDYQEHMGYVLLCLQNAFACLLSNYNLTDGLRKTVMSGGDTDTNAAVAGALLGAACGETSLEGSWKAAILSCRPIAGRCLRPRPEPLWPVDVPRVAERLLVLGMREAGL